jgi:hypothetical protein
MILVNIDREGYQYDKLLQAIPMLRVLLPQEKIGIREAIWLAAKESLSKNILFIDEQLTLTSNRPGFNQRLPHFTSRTTARSSRRSPTNSTNQCRIFVKASVSGGFLETIAIDIKGAAYEFALPEEYFCFRPEIAT